MKIFKRKLLFLTFMHCLGVTDYSENALFFYRKFQEWDFTSLNLVRL